MMYKLSNIERILSWSLQIVAAAIMLQTLYFKFSGAEESVFIFSAIGMEPWGRYGTGIVELIASILLFIPKYSWYGALMGVGLMAGAVFFHLTVIGISVEADHGTLFDLAVVTLVSCLIILYIRKNQIPFVVRYL